jgi:excisionase family DNA binding protein
MLANSEASMRWFSSEELATRFGVPVSTVRKWRHEGTGPQGVKFGRHVRYEAAEVERWEREQAAASMRRAT